MTLDDYLAKQDISDAAFAEIVQRSRTTVSRWRRRETRPDWDAMETIVAVTKGAVMPDDFLSSDPSEPEHVA